MLGLSGAFAPHAFADKFFCDGQIGEVEIDADVEIATRCEMNGTEVDGNIRLYEGGSLRAVNVEVKGKISGKSADFVDIRNTTIDGNIDLSEMVGDGIRIADNSIDGDIKLDNNRSFLEIERNYVDDNVEVRRNLGGVFIGQNIIDGDLKCDKNDPAPVLDRNSVAGKLEKQCGDSQSENPGESASGNANGNGNGNGNDDGNVGDETGDDDTADDTEADNSDVVPVATSVPPELNVGTGGAGSLDSLLLLSLTVIFSAGVCTGHRRERNRYRFVNNNWRVAPNSNVEATPAANRRMAAARTWDSMLHWCNRLDRGAHI